MKRERCCVLVSEGQGTWPEGSVCSPSLRPLCPPPPLHRFQCRPPARPPPLVLLATFFCSLLRWRGALRPGTVSAAAGQTAAGAAVAASAAPRKGQAGSCTACLSAGRRRRKAASTRHLPAACACAAHAKRGAPHALSMSVQAACPGTTQPTLKHATRAAGQPRSTLPGWQSHLRMSKRRAPPRRATCGPGERRNASGASNTPARRPALGTNGQAGYIHARQSPGPGPPPHGPTHYAASHQKAPRACACTPVAEGLRWHGLCRCVCLSGMCSHRVRRTRERRLSSPFVPPSTASIHTPTNTHSAALLLHLYACAKPKTSFSGQSDSPRVGACWLRLDGGLPVPLPIGDMQAARRASILILFLEHPAPTPRFVPSRYRRGGGGVAGQARPAAGVARPCAPRRLRRVRQAAVRGRQRAFTMQYTHAHTGCGVRAYLRVLLSTHMLPLLPLPAYMYAGARMSGALAPALPHLASARRAPVVASTAVSAPRGVKIASWRIWWLTDASRCMHEQANTEPTPHRAWYF